MMQNNKRNKRQRRTNQDSAWKDILESYLNDFMDFCLPEISRQIDWSVPFISLDKEFSVIMKASKQGKGIVDKLFKVKLLNGETRWLLFHVEVHGRPTADFPSRMLIYSYRAYDKYGEPLLSCAILTDTDPDWRPDRCEVSALGASCLSYAYRVVKITDFRGKESMLEMSQNPFATVILAQLRALESHRSPHEQRRRVKYDLTKRLFKKKFSEKAIMQLYRFIDWLICLPDELEIEYLKDVDELEEDKQMPYLSFAERYAEERGWKRGLEQAREQVKEQVKEQAKQQAKQLYEDKVARVAHRLLLKGMDPQGVAEVTQLPLEKVKKLVTQAQNRVA